MSENNIYWKNLNPKSKRLVLLWIFILKTEPIEEISSSFLESDWIDQDNNIKAYRLPEHLFMMNTNQLLRELDQAGGHPSWI